MKWISRKPTEAKFSLGKDVIVIKGKALDDFLQRFADDSEKFSDHTLMTQMISGVLSRLTSSIEEVS